MGEIGLQQCLDRLRRVRGFDIAIQFAADVGIWAEPAAGIDVIALDCVAVVIGRNTRGEHPTVFSLKSSRSPSRPLSGG